MSCSAKKICKIRHYDSNFTEVKNDFRRQKLGRKLPELLVFNFLCWAAPINERYTPTVRQRTKQHAEMRVIEAFAKQLHKICVMNRLISKDMLITKVMTTENALTAKMKIIQLLYTPSTELTTLKISPTCEDANECIIENNSPALSGFLSPHFMASGLYLTLTVAFV